VDITLKKNHKEFFQHKKKQSLRSVFQFEFLKCLKWDFL